MRHGTGVGFVFALFLACGLAWGTAGAADSGPAPEGAVHLVHDFFQGEFEADPAQPQITKLGNTLFFVGADLESGHSVWRTDGTAAGTHRVPIAGPGRTVRPAGDRGDVRRPVVGTCRDTILICKGFPNFSVKGLSP